MALMDDIAQILEFAGLGSGTAKTIVAGILPDDPDQVIALMPYGGTPPMRTQDQKAIHGPRVQVRCRAATFPVCEALAQQAAAALAPITNAVIGTTLYQSIDLLQDPFFLQRDAHDRVEFAFNLQVFHGRP